LLLSGRVEEFVSGVGEDGVSGVGAGGEISESGFGLDSGVGGSEVSASGAGGGVELSSGIGEGVMLLSGSELLSFGKGVSVEFY
jgi:hypothetical protein